MINFSTLKGVSIPEGVVTQILDASGVVLWKSLYRFTITYNANGGIGYMDKQVVTSTNGRIAYTNIDTLGFVNTTEGYYFNGWNTKADGTGAAYTEGQLIEISSDITLYAQWSNMYTVAWKKKTTDAYCKDEIIASSQTGPVSKNGSEYYLRATLGGSVIPGLGEVFNINYETSVRSMQVPYGTELYVQLINTGSYDRGYVVLNGTKQGSSSEYTYFTLPIKHDTAMVFLWEHEIGDWTDGFEIQDYWIAEINEFPRVTTNKIMILDSGVLDTSIIE